MFEFGIRLFCFRSFTFNAQAQGISGTYKTQDGLFAGRMVVEEGVNRS